jgi:LGFP repeat
MTLTITATVGEGGVNKTLDIAIVQCLLSSFGIPQEAGGAQGLEIDGKIGPKTNAAIGNFQAKQFAMQDNLVQPDDFTIKRLNALADRFNDPASPGAPLGMKHFALLKAGLDLGDLLGEAQPCQDGTGMLQRWSGGTIYHHPLTGAFEVHGAILGEYQNLGEEHSKLGYPISDEREWVFGNGRASHFQFGSIFWSPSTGVVTALSPGL